MAAPTSTGNASSANTLPIGALAASPFERLAAWCAIATGVAGFLYAIAFIVLRDATLSGLFLLLGGVLSTAALVALYGRLRAADAAFALWALVLSLTGALGSAVHGGYDLANAVNPPPAAPDLPSAVDPRGLLTFGVAGLGLLVIAWLIGRAPTLPRGLGLLGYLLAVLLLLLYLGRLVILDATSPAIVVPAVLTGFVVNPVWYVWLGLALWRTPRAA